MRIFILVFVLAFLCISNAELDHEKEFVNDINSINTTWKAELNHLTLKGVVNLLGAKLQKNRIAIPSRSRYNINEKIDLPENFSAIERWPECAEIISHIRDQGNCGSCWAFGAAETISDRICIHSNAKHKVLISSDQLVTCCTSCGNGCNGGDIAIPFQYWFTVGLVTGGDYHDNTTCKPYEIEPCEHHVKGKLKPCGKTHTYTPACVKKCVDTYNKTFEQDKYYGEKFYYVEGEQGIKEEIYKYGPVEGAFAVYQDFTFYKSGVYKHIKGRFLGGHAIKIIGWGVENGTPYWLCANSWNTDWGDKGYFKILRGSSECDIEEYATAGLPKFSN